MKHYRYCSATTASEYKGIGCRQNTITTLSEFPELWERKEKEI
jgi:hypothetical protein